MRNRPGQAMPLGFSPRIPAGEVRLTKVALDGPCLIRLCEAPGRSALRKPTHPGAGFRLLPRGHGLALVCSHGFRGFALLTSPPPLGPPCGRASNLPRSGAASIRTMPVQERRRVAVGQRLGHPPSPAWRCAWRSGGMASASSSASRRSSRAFESCSFRQCFGGFGFQSTSPAAWIGSVTGEASSSASFSRRLSVQDHQAAKIPSSPFRLRADPKRHFPFLVIVTRRRAGLRPRAHQERDGRWQRKT